MKRQYLHKRNSMLNGTIALDVPDYLPDLVEGTKVFLNIGVALCHPKDNFNKSVGRQVSSGRMSYREVLCIRKDGRESSFLIMNTDLILCFIGSHVVEIKQANFHV